MGKHVGMRWPLLWSVIGIGLAGTSYFFFVFRKSPGPPPLPVISSCKAVEPGFRRVGDHYQFDVPINGFIVNEGTQDTPPFIHGFRLKVRDSAAVLSISFGERPMESMTVDPSFLFSKHVLRRTIFDSDARPIGEDYWGYSNSRDRWRSFRLFKGGVVAKYDLADVKEADLFDRVIRSACILP